MNRYQQQKNLHLDKKVDTKVQAFQQELAQDLLQCKADPEFQSRNSLIAKAMQHVFTVFALDNQYDARKSRARNSIMKSDSTVGDFHRWEEILELMTPKESPTGRLDPVWKGYLIQEDIWKTYCGGPPLESVFLGTKSDSGKEWKTISTNVRRLCLEFGIHAKSSDSLKNILSLRDLALARNSFTAELYDEIRKLTKKELELK
jgi:hypothetical protein